MERHKVVLRFIDGSILKGYNTAFSPGDSMIIVEDEATEKRTIAIQDLKAIFYVKTFEGDKTRKDRKFYRYPVTLGKRIYIQFKERAVSSLRRVNSPRWAERAPSTISRAVTVRMPCRN